MEIGFTSSALGNLHSALILGVLLLCSLVCLALIVERWFYFRSIQLKSPEKVIAKIRSSVLSGKTDDALTILGETDGSPILSLIHLAIRNSHLPKEQLSETLRAFQLRQRMVFERSLGVLGTLGNTAPFIGLLGTVMGIIQAFRDLAGPQAQANGASVVATGIAEALIATAAGLCVAIPAVVFYNFYLKKAKHFATEMEAVSVDMLVLLSLKKAA
ncbi:MAG: MotA/TolQ/ExbB proton channel family protein [Elusimicrobiales bacterium]|jgi:biopolymer transport protein ExbB